MSQRMQHLRVPQKAKRKLNKQKIRETYEIKGFADVFYASVMAP